MFRLYAKSWKEAEVIAEKRNIGEKILGVSAGVKDGYNRKISAETYSPTFIKITDYDFINQLPKIIHLACFLCFVGANQKTLTINDCISDNGIIHKLIHLMNEDRLTKTKIRTMRIRFVRLQKSIFGYLPK